MLIINKLNIKLSETIEFIDIPNKCGLSVIKKQKVKKGILNLNKRALLKYY